MADMHTRVESTKVHACAWQFAGPSQADDGDSGPRVETLSDHAPHNAVKAEGLSLFVGSRCLLHETDLKLAEHTQTAVVQTPPGASRTVHHGKTYGLVGPNGCGKSTLLRMLDKGRVPVPSSWERFLMSQELPAVVVGRLPVEEVLMANTARAALFRSRESLQEELAQLAEVSGEEERFLQATSLLAEVEVELLRWDRAEEVEVSKFLMALGFRGQDEIGVQGSEPTLATPMDKLSGGWRMRVELAKALWLKPKLLLLDEPTNHLDYKSLNWLEDHLDEYPYTVVIVSHDVSFLHRTCREILWIKDKKIEAMPREMISHEDLVRMQRRRPLNFKFSFPEGDSPERHGLSLHGVEFSYNNDGGSTSRQEKRPFLHVKRVGFSGLSRSVVLGRNGSGKSTFLELCSGKLSPDRGSLDKQDCKVAYYSQQMDEIDRYPLHTAAAFVVQQCRQELEAKVQRGAKHGGKGHADASERGLVEFARGVLSNFGFEDEIAVTVPLERLSGGQKSCLKLAVLSLQPAHILLLDEPTNHLDAEACQSLAKALAAFPGGVVVVTHDDLLIYRLIQCNWSQSEIVVCQDGQVHSCSTFGADCLKGLKDLTRESEAQAAVGGPRLPPEPEPVPTTPVLSSTSGGAAGGGALMLPPWLQPRRTRPSEVAKAVRIGDKTFEPLVKTAEPKSSKQMPQKVIESVPTPTRRIGRPSGVQSGSCWGKTLAMQKSAEVVDVVVEVRSSVPISWEDVDVGAPVEEPVPPSWEELADREDAERGVERSTCVGDEDRYGYDICVPGWLAEAPRISAAAPDFQQVGCNAASGTSALPKRPPAYVPPHRRHLSDNSEDKSLDLPGEAACEPERTTPPFQKHDRVAKPSAPTGHHSRFRKDLVNLNKAVVKWLGREARGEMSRSEILENITNSAVVAQLRVTRECAFDDASFAQEALNRAVRVRGAKPTPRFS